MYENNSQVRNDIFEKYCEDLKLSDKDLESIREEQDHLSNPNNWQELSFVYYGEPKAQPRARSTAVGNFFYDPGKGLKLWLLEQLKAQLPKDFSPIEKEIFFEACFYKPIPKSVSKKEKVLMESGLRRPVGRPDIDNYVKLVQDALNKVFYTDDSVITCLTAKKFYSSVPRVEISIKYMK